MKYLYAVLAAVVLAAGVYLAGQHAERAHTLAASALRAANDSTLAWARRADSLQAALDTARARTALLAVEADRARAVYDSIRGVVAVVNDTTVTINSVPTPTAEPVVQALVLGDLALTACDSVRASAAAELALGRAQRRADSVRIAAMARADTLLAQRIATLNRRPTYAKAAVEGGVLAGVAILVKWLLTSH